MVLKDCPFCGSDRVIVSGVYPRFFGKCMDCNAEGPVKSNIEAASTAWDRRIVYETAEGVQ